MPVDEIDVLKAIGRGHPHRRVTVVMDGQSRQVSGLTRDEIQIATQSSSDEIGNAIASLVQKGQIAMGREIPSLLGSLFGRRVADYMCITSAGEAALLPKPAPSEASDWMDDDDIEGVEQILHELGFELTAEGVVVAKLSLGGGYSDAETASNIALATVARDVREKGSDIRVLMAIATHAHVMLTVLNGYRERGLMDGALFKNDALALHKASVPSSEQDSWVDRILSDPTVGSHRLGRSIDDYGL